MLKKHSNIRPADSHTEKLKQKISLRVPLSTYDQISVRFKTNTHAKHYTNRYSTLSGWLRLPTALGFLGSHNLTVQSQLPVMMQLTSGEYSTQRIAASCWPTAWSDWHTTHTKMYWEKITFINYHIGSYSDAQIMIDFIPWKKIEIHLI